MEPLMENNEEQELQGCLNDFVVLLIEQVLKAEKEYKNCSLKDKDYCFGFLTTFVKFIALMRTQSQKFNLEEALDLSDLDIDTDFSI